MKLRTAKLKYNIVESDGVASYTYRPKDASDMTTSEKERLREVQFHIKEKITALLSLQSFQLQLENYA